MKKQIFSGIALAVMFSLSACSVRHVTSGMGEGEHYDAVISVKGNSAAQANPQGVEDAGQIPGEAQQLEQLLSLLSKEDKEAAVMFGGGRENRTADGSVLIGRSYETEIFGNAAHLYTSYDEGGRVGMIFLEIPDGDAAYFLETLSEITGTKPEVLEETEGSGWQWQLKDCTLTLYEIEGVVSMDLVPAYTMQR